MKTITCLFGGSRFSFFEEVAIHFGIHEGQTIDELTFWDALDMHCDLGTQYCFTRKLAADPD